MDVGIAVLLFFIFIVLPALAFYYFIIPISKSAQREMDSKIREELKHQRRMSKLCSNLTSLSSIIVKCPNCQHVFLRTDKAQASWAGKNAAKLRELYPNGLEYMQLSKEGGGQFAGTLNPGNLEAFAKTVSETGGCLVYPSSFNCPKCSYLITRSREPSAMCRTKNIRVSGIRLLGCTVGRCYEPN